MGFSEENHLLFELKQQRFVSLKRGLSPNLILVAKSFFTFEI